MRVFRRSCSNASAFWMPFTSNKEFKNATKRRVVVEGQGMFYSDKDGRKILDAASGLWCSNAGISPRPVVEAAQQQLSRMSYAPSFQMSSDIAFEWADAVVQEGDLMERSLNKVFFTPCGSSAVDTSLKIALAYHRANGEAEKTRFIGRERGYHGVGFGGLSVGGIGANREMFSSALINGVDHLKHTHSILQTENSHGQSNWGAHLADDIENIVALHGTQNIAGVIIEPVAGSTGVLVPPIGYLERVKELCCRHDLLLIFDEVITGFGRLGTPFASERFDVTPDIFTVAKGLTGAVIPAGAVVVRGTVYDTIINASPQGIEFCHGYTYSAHPVAAAAGIAMIKHYRDDGLYEMGKALIPTFEELIHQFDDDDTVLDVRNIGLMGAVQLRVPDGARTFASEVMDDAWHTEGVYLRTNGPDTIAFCPAFIASVDHLEDIFTRTRRSIHRVTSRYC